MATMAPVPGRSTTAPIWSAACRLVRPAVVRRRSARISPYRLFIIDWLNVVVMCSPPVKTC